MTQPFQKPLPPEPEDRTRIQPSSSLWNGSIYITKDIMDAIYAYQRIHGPTLIKEILNLWLQHSARSLLTYLSEDGIIDSDA